MPPSKVCLNKLKKEMRDFMASPPPFIPAVCVNEKNILEWHFLIQGPPETPYAGGSYIGKIRFPVDYPFKPPALLMVTPNGRFETGVRLCLSMSDFHPETWQPSWNVASILTGLLSFMLEDTMTTGSITTTDEEKRALAAQSAAWALRNKQLAAMFPEHLKEAGASSSGAKGSTSAAAAGQGRKGGREPDQAATAAQPLGARDAALCRATAKDLEDGDPEGAKQRLEKYFKKLSVKGGQAPAPELQLMLATATASAGDLEAAAQLAERAGAVESRGLADDGAGLATGAADTFRAAAAAKAAGNAAYRAGDYAAARDAYLECVEREPRCSAAHCNLAVAHAQLGRHDLAVAAAQEALRLNRRYVKARQRMEESARALRQS